jgi:inhibitor of KinA sporulation pathway (predicted exonuclease)
MRIPNDYYLIVDLEATCSNDGSVPRQEMEIIEIGAVMQNTRTFEVESEFQIFIRPVRHPQLTSFCTELTSITQEQVDSAPSFREGIEALKEWMYPFGDTLFCSWGHYDRKQFHQDCDYHQVAYPFRSDHLNLKLAYSEATGQTKKPGLAEALKHLALEFEGTHHRGLDDARNIARIVRKVCIGV